jgi:hypothetical protein
MYVTDGEGNERNGVEECVWKQSVFLKELAQKKKECYMEQKIFNKKRMISDF